MSWRISSEPSTEPVTLTEAKDHLRVDFSDEDTYITSLIVTARRVCESYCNKVFITQTWIQNEDEFLDPISLKVNPVISLTSLKYYDSNEVLQTVTDDTDNLQKDFNSDVAKLYSGLVNGFPSIGSTINPIEITTVCGYGDASSVPEDIKSAMKIVIAHLYENRNMVNVPLASIATDIMFPSSVYLLLNRYRINVFG